MAEIIGTVSAVSSLVTEGTELVKTITKIVRAVRHAALEINKALDELESIIDVLRQFETNLGFLRSEKVPSNVIEPSFFRLVDKSNTECSSIFDEMRKALENAMPGVLGQDGDHHIRKRDQLRWPLNQHEVRALQLKLRTYLMDLGVYATVINNAIHTWKMRVDLDRDKHSANYKYRISMHQLNIARLNAKEAKLDLKRFQDGGDIKPEALQHQDTGLSHDTQDTTSDVSHSFANRAAKLDTDLRSGRLRADKGQPDGSHDQDHRQSCSALRIHEKSRADSVGVDPADEPTINHGQTRTKATEVGQEDGPVSQQLEDVRQAPERSTEGVNVDFPVDQRFEEFVRSTTPASAVCPSQEAHATIHPSSTPQVGNHDLNVVTELTSVLTQKNGIQRKPLLPAIPSRKTEVCENPGASQMSSDVHMKPCGLPQRLSPWRLPGSRDRQRPTQSKGSYKISPGSHSAILLKQESYEWQKLTLRPPDEEICTTVQNFQRRHKLVLDYYSRIAPEQIQMLENSCEDAATGHSPYWTVVAIKIRPKRARGFDIRSIEAIIRLERSLGDPKRQKRQSEKPLMDPNAEAINLPPLVPSLPPRSSTMRVHEWRMSQAAYVKNSESVPQKHPRLQRHDLAKGTTPEFFVPKVPVKSGSGQEKLPTSTDRILASAAALPSAQLPVTSTKPQISETVREPTMPPDPNAASLRSNVQPHNMASKPSPTAADMPQGVSKSSLHEHVTKSIDPPRPSNLDQEQNARANLYEPVMSGALPPDVENAANDKSDPPQEYIRIWPKSKPRKSKISWELPSSIEIVRRRPAPIGEASSSMIPALGLNRFGQSRPPQHVVRPQIYGGQPMFIPQIWYPYGHVPTPDTGQYLWQELQQQQQYQHMQERIDEQVRGRLDEFALHVEKLQDQPSLTPEVSIHSPLDDLDDDVRSRVSDVISRYSAVGSALTSNAGDLMRRFTNIDGLSDLERDTEEEDEEEDELVKDII